MAKVSQSPSRGKNLLIELSLQEVVTAPHSPRMLEICAQGCQDWWQGLAVCVERHWEEARFSEPEVHTLSCDSRDENDKAVNLRILGRGVPPAFRH